MFIAKFKVNVPTINNFRIVLYLVKIDWLVNISFLPYTKFHILCYREIIKFVHVLIQKICIICIIFV